ncbi:hypothetical protein ACSBR2_027587 [Camellia fascicularis]
MKSSTMPQTLVEFLDITILPCHSCCGTHLRIPLFCHFVQMLCSFLVMLTISVALALLIVTIPACYGIHL